MKKLMQTSLAALLLAGVTLAASAQDVGMGKKSQELGQKIGLEVMQEVMKDGGKPTPESVGKKLVEKLRANQDEMKKPVPKIAPPFTVQTKPAIVSVLPTKPTMKPYST